MIGIFYLIATNDAYQLPVTTCESVAEVAEYLGVSSGRVSQMIKDGEKKGDGKFLVFRIEEV